MNKPYQLTTGAPEYSSIINNFFKSIRVFRSPSLSQFIAHLNSVSSLNRARYIISVYNTEFLNNHA